MRLALVFVLIYSVYSYPQEKAKILGDKEISSLSDQSDSANAKIIDDGNVQLDFKGKSQISKGQSGTAKANQAGKGDSFTGVAPNGQKGTGKVDKAKKTGTFVDAKGNKIDADATNDKLINAKVNGKDGYKVVRDEKGNAEVFNKNAGQSAHQVQNLKEGTDNIIIETPNKPERVETLKSTKDSSGKLKNTQTSDSEHTIPRVPIGNKNSAKMDYQGSSKSDLTIGKSFGATGNDALALGAAGEVSSDAVDTKPCYTGPSGKDALDEKSGIRIIEKSIKFEAIKDAEGQYNFPDCFNVLADVFVPAGVNVADLAVSSQVTTPTAGGDLQCDPKVACLDRTTSNRPSGSCFFCDFCKKEQPQGAFGVGSDANLCDAKAGGTLNLKWKLCPPTKAAGPFIPFAPSGQKTSGDIVSVIRLFLRSAAKKWEEVACKQSIYSFKVGIAGKQIGSKPSTNKIVPVKSTGGSSGGNSFGSLFGNGFGKK